MWSILVGEFPLPTKKVGREGHRAGGPSSWVLEKDDSLQTVPHIRPVPRLEQRASFDVIKRAAGGLGPQKGDHLESKESA